MFFYKNIFCERTAFLQKYISLKKQVFYDRTIGKKVGFLQIKGSFFTKIYFCKKAGFVQPYFVLKSRLFTEKRSFFTTKAVF